MARNKLTEERIKELEEDILSFEEHKIIGDFIKTLCFRCVKHSVAKSNLMGKTKTNKDYKLDKLLTSLNSLLEDIMFEDCKEEIESERPKDPLDIYYGEHFENFERYKNIKAKTQE